jgi:uroporphyrinogen decarboxylase
MNHRQRIEACLSEKPLDRVPVALWRHFPVDDQDPHRLAKAVINFQKTYDFDIVKVTPVSTYFIKDWGLDDTWTGNPEGTREYTKRIIHEPEDWTNLRALDPAKGQLGSELECLRIITKELGPEVPVIETVFSPIGQANKMAGQEVLLHHLRLYPDAVHQGLETITQYTQQFIEALKDTGIAGVFYAVQWGQYSIMSIDEFGSFGSFYDLKVLESAQDFWLNLLHLHGKNIMFDLMSNYPVQIINWHDQETAPTLTQAKQKYPGVICGGLRQWETLAYGTPEDIFLEARAAIDATEGERFILGTGCVTPIITAHGNLMAARLSVEKTDQTK